MRQCASRRYRLFRQPEVWRKGRLGEWNRIWGGSKGRVSPDQACGFATRVDRGRPVGKPRERRGWEISNFGFRDAKRNLGRDVAALLRPAAAGLRRVAP